MTETYKIGIACVGTHAPMMNLATETLALILPDMPVRTLERTRGKELGAGDVAIIAERDATAALETLRHLRASGYTGNAILLADVTDEAALQRWAPARTISPDQVPSHLGAVITGITSADASPGDPVVDALHRTRRLLAAGEIAFGLQHSINNPLTALLAEAQLLEFEELAPEHREAVARIITACRRVIELVRTLDGLSERKPLPKS